MAQKKPARARPKAPGSASRLRKASPSGAISSPAPARTADLRTAPPPVLGDIPWGYGVNRITGMARDPEWIFVYWEISDAALAAARALLGDPQAGCSLRVYDTTNLDFNGLNPHLFWDIGVDRATNQYTLKVGRPAAAFHVDIGVRGASGAFAPVARSGSIEMPRDSVSPDHRVEWSTVVRSGRTPSYRHRHVPGPASSVPQAPPPSREGQGGLEDVFRHFSAEGWTRSEWVETRMDGRAVRWVKWSGPFAREQFPNAPAGTYSRIEILYQGERRVVLSEQGERYVYGPWHAVLEAVTTGGERKTIHQWVVRHRWTTGGVSVRVQTPAILTRIQGGERVTVEVSGSEQRLSREAWGSEWLQAGASEWRWSGASETLLAGASELQATGASERLWLGASEIVRGGASERRWGGGSELWAEGASDARLSGSSGSLPLGPGEERT